MRGNRQVDIDVDYGYWVPFIPSLQQVLSCPEILNCVDNPLPVEEGVFTSPLDSYYYQNHPVVQANPKTLGVGTYTDGVGVTDTASSKSADHGVTFIYWTLLNIYPNLRSSVQSIFLLGVIKTSVLKKYSFTRIMKDFVDSMKSLYNGVNFDINNERRKFHAILVFNSGDNPAAASLAGFKESHFANKVCRQCLAPKEDLYKYFDESKFPARSYQSHINQVNEVLEFRRTQGNRNERDPSVTYGINSRSVFMDIPLCDVTKCFPQDLMHDTIEGTLRLEICLLLLHVIESGKMSLSTINQRIALFSKYFGVNKPAHIEKDHLDKKKLRQSASETLSLAYMLPFVLRKKNMVSGKMESVCAQRNLDCFILRLELLDLLMSRAIRLVDVERVRSMTTEHHLLFKSLYPGFEIPKLHFEIHQATQILLFGPPTQHWCFRYESKHAFFKRLCRILRSFKNLAGTFSKYHQRHQAALMMISTKRNEPYLKEGSSLGAPVRKLVKAVPVHHQQLISRVFPGISLNDNISVYKVCKVNGVKYRKNSAFITSLSSPVPLFGNLLAIYGYQGKVAFVFRQLKTYSYERELKAFKVGNLTGFNLDVMPVSQLLHHHHLPFIKSVGASYISVPRKSFSLS
ncbi:uncharacterized protein LOC117642407 [Thrips palmi]|uniref:Uncharacterized protein LOC117642407 n=1 Tax=Thrips palmi TaxID=161013 RepID=A0A6P8YIK4_THRPL|nr:uncharacterized protein LOC117642407 [Thrips palmi]